MVYGGNELLSRVGKRFGFCHGLKNTEPIGFNSVRFKTELNRKTDRFGLIQLQIFKIKFQFQSQNSNP